MILGALNQVFITQIESSGVLMSCELRVRRRGCQLALAMAGQPECLQWAYPGHCDRALERLTRFVQIQASLLIIKVLYSMIIL